MMIRSTSQIARLTALKNTAQSQKQQSRSFIGALAAVPNTIKAGQAKQMAGGICQGAENPTYLKQGGADKATNAFGMFLVGFALSQIGYGFYHLANGTNQLE